MAKAFDPYLKWLGIRKKTNRRVNHYRLLGVELFESDVDVLANAAERQIRHVESFATTEHREDCERIISEIRAARDCLLYPATRQQYDQKIKRKLAAAQDGAKSTKKRADDQKLAVNIDVGNNAPVDDGSPNFDFGGQVDTGPSPRSEAAAAKPRGKQSRQGQRKRKRPGFDWAGWILGGLGAVAFAWVLVNTDLVDWIKGRVPGDEVASNEIGQEANDSSTPSGEQLSSGNLASSEVETGEPAIDKPGDSSKGSSDKEPEATSADDGSADNNASVDSDSDSPTVEHELPTIKSGGSRENPNPNPNVRSESARPSRRKPAASRSASSNSGERGAIPPESAIAAAMEAIRKAHKPELKGRDRTAKKILARRLFHNSARQKTPALQYAALQMSTELAGQVGELTTLVKASEQIARKFKVDFWEHIEEPANDAIGSVDSVGAIADGLTDVLEMAYSDGQFKIAARLADRAAKIAREEGDWLQNEMLIAYSKDMKSFEALRKRAKTIEGKPDQDGLSTKDKQVLGEYRCFGVEEWDDGLKLLGEGADRRLASVAKTDLNSGDNSRDRIDVAEAWIKLSEKSKYKGFQRRGMLWRAEHKIDDLSLPNPKVNGMYSTIRMMTQPVKVFVAPSDSVRRKTYLFDIQGNTTFDSASLVGGRSLRLGRGRRSRVLVTNPISGDESEGYEAFTQDGNTRFLIRWLDTGIVDMRVYDNVSGQLQIILYGKAM